VEGANRATAALTLLNEIAQVATAGLELRPLLQRITDTLIESFDWDHACFALIDGEAGEFVVEAATSRIESPIAAGLRRTLGTGIVGVVSATGRPVAVDDVASHPEYVELNAGMRTEVCLPLVRGGEVIAVLNLEDRRKRDLAAEMPLLEAVCRQVTGAIANARLHAEVARRARQFELVAELIHSALDEDELEPVLTKIAGRLRERFDLGMVAVYLVDPSSSRLDLRAAARRRDDSRSEALRSLGPGQGIIGRALQLGRAQLVLDVRSDPDYVASDPMVVAELAIPIRFRARTLGVLNFENERAQAFSQETVSLLQLLCDQLAGVVHLAAVNQQLSATTEELEQSNRRLREMNRTLTELSIVDSLTGLANRRQFDRLLDLEWRRAVRSALPLALLFIDIDFFKPYNDVYGHLRGDAVLAEVAKVLASSFTRAGDLVARYGGEEFAVLLPNTDQRGAADLAELARARVEARGIPHPASSTSAVLTASIGVATSRGDARLTGSSLVESADRALYRAKAEGRNRVELADPEADDALRRGVGGR
jgi:diguanylate cyclase (GGDEF)-like protein